MPSRPTDRLIRGDASRGSRGSFHAGAPIPTLGGRGVRRQPTHNRYQTFPTTPPKTPLEPPRAVNVDFSTNDSGGEDSDDDDDDAENTSDDGETPLPVRQLLLLAFLSLCEQTALNSIGPYLPEMVSSMPGLTPGKTGLYVGILASSFALAQLSTNLLWGYASDIVGRKPVLLLGTFALMCCFSVFGLCNRYWQVIVVHVAMGMLNGNAACVPTVLGEVTDRSNQSRAFIYLPIIYSLGGITGPALGGVLVGKMGRDYPYLGPNVLGAALLAVSFVVIAIWFEETLEEPQIPNIWRPRWTSRFFAWVRGAPKRPPLHTRSSSWSARWPRAHRDVQPLLSARSSTSSADGDNESDAGGDDKSPGRTVWRELLNKTTILLLCTYLVFQLSNISFNSLYPIFVASPPPAGRDLDPGTIGVSLSLAGVATIIFQAFVFQPVKSRLGNLGAYKYSLLGLAIAMVLMPWVGYKEGQPFMGMGSGKTWLYIELGVVLIIKNICAVGGLSCVMLLITNSAPSHASLGTLNGVAQTLSALGRSFGPFVSGGLFTLSTNIHPKGEALAWSLFGGLAFFGFLGSLFIHGEHLESDDWVGHDEDDEHQTA